MRSISIVLAILALSLATQAAGNGPTTMTFIPGNPALGDTVAVTIRSTWHDSCVPHLANVTVTGRVIRIDAIVAPCINVICFNALVPYTLTTVLPALPSAGEYTVQYYARECGTADPTLDTTQTLFVSATACPFVTTLCLGGGRFQATASWQTPDGRSGDGRGVAQTDKSGSFWFFEPANAEVMVKVLDDCGGPTRAFWVFAAGVTNVQVDLTVKDTATNTTRTYSNPLGKAFAPVLDTSAFKTCP